MKVTLKLIAIILIIVSCSNPKAGNADQSSEKKLPQKELKEIVMKDYNDAAELFSIKYDISRKNSETIIQEYIIIYDPLINQILTGNKDIRIGEKLLKPEESLYEFINRMNKITGEDPAKISSFVIDLKMYLKLMESDN